jgi:hypothetical protein
MLWFLNIFAEKNCKKLSFFTHNKAKLCKNFHNIGFWEKRHFFRRKLSKIAENCDHNIGPRFFENIWTTFFRGPEVLEDVGPLGGCQWWPCTLGAIFISKGEFLLTNLSSSICVNMRKVFFSNRLCCWYVCRLSVDSSEDQGSMLCSQFSAIFDNFLRKNWRFSKKPMLW